MFAIGANYLTAGNALDDHQHDYIWLNCASSSLKLPRANHIPIVHRPLADSFQPLKDLMDTMQSLLSCNFIPSLGILAGLVMGLGYEKIVTQYDFYPAIIAIGGLSCGKTTSLISALSTIGSHKTGIVCMLPYH